jgi:mannose-1-phosphate guanylyltransferase
MVRFHRERSTALTISLTPVADTSSYGVVDMDASGRISRFIEKPKPEDAPSNLINAGIYILEPEALAMMPTGQHYMFEFGLFPTLLERGRPMYGYNPPTPAYWIDIGKPERYLDANRDLLNGKVAGLAWQPAGSQHSAGVWADDGCDISSEAHLSGAIVLGKRCRIAAGARIVGAVVMADNCSIGREANIADAVLWDGVSVSEGATLRRCVIGENASIGPCVSISGGTVIGDRASIGAGNQLANSLRVNCNINLPDEAITF